MHAPDRIRNVAVVGHRGSGKTALTDALLFHAGKLDRLGTLAKDPDEQARGMTISVALHDLEWTGRKVNLLDTPGEPSFVADALGALRVCESAVFVVNAVMGVEVGTSRLWTRAAELDLARMLYVNMLDRERADFFRTLDALKAAFGRHVVATEIPIGAEHEVRGLVDLVDMKAWIDDVEVPIPDDVAPLAAEYREKLMDEVCEVSEALMERYLEGEEISHDEIVGALKDGTNHGDLFPVVCGVANRGLGATRLLDAIVEDLPSPVKHGDLELPEVTLTPDPDRPLYAYVFKTKADPFTGRVSLFRVFQGVMRHGRTEVVGPGDMGSAVKLKDVRTGSWLTEGDAPASMPTIPLPAPVMAFAITAKGDEDKVFGALRRLQEEDPTIDLHRDPQTGEQIVAGLSQMHVEVVVDRLRSRFGCVVELAPPRVPYQETVRGEARAHGRHKKQSGGRGQFGDCHIVLEPLGTDGDGPDLEFVSEIRGGVIPASFIPAVERGVRDAMAHGPSAGYPVKGVRVRLVDGSFHTVDSSEHAFRTAGALAMRQAMEDAGGVLLEPIMRITLTVPEASVGEVIGDLNGRRGRPQGMEPSGATTTITAEVPMSEVLAYAPDLRTLTGGQGEYALELVRYEEVPAHLAGRVAAVA
jgi:elongation factor G